MKRMVILYMMMNMLMVNVKVMENVYNNGNYNIGQWLKGHKYGKGIQYYKDSKIIYNVNLLMIKEKVMENILMIMVNIILDNG